MNKNDVKFWAAFLLILFIFSCMYFFPKRNPNTEQTQEIIERLIERQKKIDSLEAIVNNYEQVEIEEIAKYFHNKYNKNHEEIDSNDVSADVFFLQQFFSNRNDIQWSARSMVDERAIKTN